MSHDGTSAFMHVRSMSSGETAKAFKRAFTNRVRSARVNVGYTLIPAFCLATGVTYEWLFTGRTRESAKSLPKKKASLVYLSR